MTPTTGPTSIDAYVDEVAARLVGPTALRASVLAELADGLHCAAADARTAGRTPNEAAAAAITAFGDPDAVARAFLPELVAAHARWVALLLVRSGPIVGAVWLLPLLMSAPTVRAAGPLWAQAAAAMRTYVPLWPVAIGCTATAAFVVFAATGRSARRLPARTVAVAPYAAAAVAATTATGDIALLASLPALLHRGAPVALTLFTAAAVTSLIRLAASGWSAHRCLARGRPAAP